MATILEFRTQPGQRRLGRLGRAERGDCEVVIFPGVRIARWQGQAETPEDVPPPSHESGHKSGKQRRR